MEFSSYPDMIDNAKKTFLTLKRVSYAYLIRRPVP